MGCLVESCTLIGLATAEDGERDGGEAANEGERVATLKDLLAEAFSNLKLHSSHGSIACLSLQVIAGTEGPTGKVTTPEEFQSWRRIWDTARQTYRIAMYALNASGLSLREELDIFTAHRVCSLSCTDFVALHKIVTSKAAFGTLKRLKASISLPHDENDDYDMAKDVPVELVHRKNLFALAMQTVKRTMPQLEDMTLQCYNIHRFRGYQRPPGDREVRDLALSREDWPRLQGCNLHGVDSSEEEMLSFLEASAPRVLQLTFVVITSGTWAPIFDFIAGDKSPVSSFRLGDLCDNKSSLIRFDEAGRDKLQQVYGNSIPSAIAEEGGSDEIRHRFPAQGQHGIPGSKTWRTNASSSVGPIREPYDYVGINSRDYAVDSGGFGW